MAHKKKRKDSIKQRPDRNRSARHTLRRMRAAAGFDRAEDFAAALGMAPEYYMQFERQSDGPRFDIGIADAWAIADKLHCSIDHVVGRMGADEPAQGSLEELYLHMNEQSRCLFLELADVAWRHNQRTNAREGGR